MSFTKGTKTTFIVSTILLVVVVLCLAFTICLVSSYSPDGEAGDQIGWGLTLAIFWPIFMVVSGGCTLGSLIPFLCLVKRMKGKSLYLNLTATVLCFVLTVAVIIIPLIAV